MGIRILILITGGVIASLSIIFGYEKVVNVGDAHFILVALGVLSGIVSMLVQHWYAPENTKKENTGSTIYSPQGLMALSSIGVIVVIAIYLYFTYVRAG